ncbi:hypothetical protein KIN20_038383 [Parelaphostrongylus tenuis]|uniref:Uncharacterized protein n=1 Tax=Parelaphostrongylus tenuis TaxID=148309 RepID=A0AAD5MET4_PARTN|nr:hypothetical protein KIN20_038383 [Parelaphostrongylus tenuis]
MSSQRLALSILSRHGQRFISLPNPVTTNNESHEAPPPVLARFSDVVLPLINSYNNSPPNLQFSTILGCSQRVPSLIYSTNVPLSIHPLRVNADSLPYRINSRPNVVEVGVQTDDCWLYSVKTAGPVSKEEQAKWDLENSIGEGLLKIGETREAIRRFEEAASHGNANAINNLAECLYSGIGVVRDKEKAFSLWEEAVSLGHVNAMYSLAVCLIRAATAGEPKGDKLRAFQLMRKAAIRGNVHAAFYLVVRYIRDSDPESAKDVIRIAARDEDYANKMRSWTEGSFLEGKCFQLVKQMLIDPSS